MPATLFDSHAHLCDESFDVDRSGVLRRAEGLGVKAILAVSETLTDAEKTVQLSRTFPNIKPAVGLYPEYASLEAMEEVVTFIRKNLTNIYAIGEIGLDYWLAKDEAARELQRQVFSRFIALAKELDLPLNIHSRSAGRQVIEILLEQNAPRVQLHAFDGKFTTAQAAVEAGYFFSVPPSIIRSRQKEKLIRQLPISCLLLESDSPVLGPDPEHRNEPANIIIALEAIAALKNIPVEEVRQEIRLNSIRLYGDKTVG